MKTSLKNSLMKKSNQRLYRQKNSEFSVKHPNQAQERGFCAEKVAVCLNYT